MLKQFSIARWFVVAVMLLMLGVVPAVAANDVADCNQSVDPDLRIHGCTNLIDSQQFAGNDIAIAYSNRGIAYYDKKEYDRAIADYENALEKNPYFSEAYSKRLEVYRLKGEADPAIADCNQSPNPDLRIHGCTNLIDSQRLGNNIAVAYNNRGLAYYDKGDLDRAIAEFSWAIKIDPDYAIAYSNRGNAYRAKGDLDRAIADCGKAKNINPNTKC